MPEPGNREQIEYWNGPAGERWTRYQAQLDRAIGEFGRAAMGRLDLRSGQRVLDVGCGCGETTFELADRVGPGGYVCGVDVSRAMLEHARTRIAGRTHVELLVADAAEQRYPRPFDRIYSRFGVMFFADPAAAFGSLREALVPGGRLVFACWRALEQNSWGALPLQWVQEVLPAPAAPIYPDGPGPYALAAPARIEAILGRAGFSALQLEAFDGDVVFSTSGIADAVRFAMFAGPASRLLQGVSESERAAAEAVLTERLAPYQRGGRIALGGSAWIVTAHATGTTP